MEVAADAIVALIVAIVVIGVAVEWVTRPRP